MTRQILPVIILLMVTGFHITLSFVVIRTSRSSTNKNWSQNSLLFTTNPFSIRYSTSTTTTTTTTTSAAAAVTNTEQFEISSTINTYEKESFYCLRCSSPNTTTLSTNTKFNKLQNTCIVECKSNITNYRIFVLCPKYLVKIREIPFSEGKLGGSVWYASIALSQFIALNSDFIKDKRILELGAGVGLPGLTCGIIGTAKKVTCSEFGLDVSVDTGEGDYNHEEITIIREQMEQETRLVPTALLNNLRFNIKLNELNHDNKMKVRHLDWYDYLPNSTKALDDNDDEDDYDLIIGSDLINWEDDVRPLICTLKYFLHRCINTSNTSQKREALIALSGENRRAMPEFLTLLRSEFHNVSIQNLTLVHYDVHPILLISLS